LDEKGKFAMQFLSKGLDLKFKVNGKTQSFIAKENGKFASSTLTIKSDGVANYFNEYQRFTNYAMTNELKKDGTNNDLDGEYNINKGVNFEVTIDPFKGQSTDEYINTILHEFFVHVEENLVRLNDLSNDLNNGTTKVGSINYKNQIYNIVNSADADHKKLGSGGLSNYQNAANQIDLNRKMGIQLKKYNEDVQEQKKQGF